MTSSGQASTRKASIGLTWKPALSGFILALASLYQLRQLAGGWAGNWLAQLPQTMEMPALRRGALYLGGEQFAEYIEFVRENTPTDARIILPPRLPERLESNVGIMQFFLFPREIHNCGVGEVQECVRRITGPRSYLLALPDFPPRDLASQTRRFLSFDGESGLFGPP